MEPERESPSGVVWYHHVSVELTIETREITEWSNGEKYLTIALCGPTGACTMVTDECSIALRGIADLDLPVRTNQWTGWQSLEEPFRLLWKRSGLS